MTGQQRDSMNRNPFHYAGRHGPPTPYEPIATAATAPGARKSLQFSRGSWTRLSINTIAAQPIDFWWRCRRHAFYHERPLNGVRPEPASARDRSSEADIGRKLLKLGKPTDRSRSKIQRQIGANTDDLAIAYSLRSFILPNEAGELSDKIEVSAALSLHTPPELEKYPTSWRKVDDDYCNHNVEIPVPQLRLKPGQAVDLIIEDPSSRRRSVGLPVDCIARLGRSPEILMHTGWGQLTPVEVNLGFEIDGFIEIKDPLLSSLGVVRDLTEVMNDHRDVNAAMVGLWEPKGLR